MLFHQPVELGLDPSLKSVAEARGQGVYCQLAVASGTAIPCPAETFASVLSNCVLEHVPDLDATLREVNRVTQKGGVFAFTVPSQNFTRFLFFPTLFRRLGLAGLAQRYEGWFNAISRHYHCYGPEAWQRKLGEAGFEVVEWRYYMSPAATRVFDLCHYLSAPALVTRRLFGRWVLFPGGGSLVLLEWLLRRYYEEQWSGEGAYLLFVCRKSGHLEH